MSACDTCRSPGHCCRNIRLFGSRSIAPNGEVVIPDDVDPKRYVASINGECLPFEPAAKLVTYGADLPGRFDGLAIPTGSTWSWSCPRLQADGRCGDYENRPFLCRSFKPGEDSLCLESPTYAGEQPA